MLVRSHGVLHTATRQRHHARQPLRVAGDRVLDRLRRHRPAELRAGRGVHDRRIHRALRPDGARRPGRTDGSGRARARPDVRGRSPGLGSARSPHRARRLQAASRQLSHGAADHGARRLHLPAELRSAPARARHPELRIVELHPRDLGHPRRPAADLARADPRDRHSSRAHDPPHSLREAHATSGARCAPSRTTARPRR